MFNRKSSYALNKSLDTAEVRMESPRSIPSKRLQSKGSTKDFSPVTALPR